MNARADELAYFLRRKRKVLMYQFPEAKLYGGIGAVAKIAHHGGRKPWWGIVIMMSVDGGFPTHMWCAVRYASFRPDLFRPTHLREFGP
jgi:hypothetical protein